MLGLKGPIGFIGFKDADATSTVHKNGHVGVQRITDAAAPSCRQKKQTRWGVPPEKTDMLPCTELRILRRHRVQWITDAETPSCRRNRQTRWRARNCGYGCNIGPSINTTRWRAMNYGCCCAIVPSEKTDTMSIYLSIFLSIYLIWSNSILI